MCCVPTSWLTGVQAVNALVAVPEQSCVGVHDDRRQALGMMTATVTDFPWRATRLNSSSMETWARQSRLPCIRQLQMYDAALYIISRFGVRGPMLGDAL